MKTDEWLGSLCKALKTKYWPTCFSHILSAFFLKQNYPKNISDVPSKILEKKEHNYQMFCLNLWSSWNWVSCGESWKSLLPIFHIFHRTDFGGFLVCCSIAIHAIQQFNSVEKNYVAITLMLNHILTGPTCKGVKNKQVNKKNFQMHKPVQDVFLIVRKL